MSTEANDAAPAAETGRGPRGGYGPRKLGARVAGQRTQREEQRPKVNWRPRNPEALEETGRYYIDEADKQDGFEYQWIRMTYAGKDDIRHQVRMQRDGAWDPVLAREFPSFAGPFIKESEHLVLDGLGLFKRPIELGDEAREQEKRKANGQVRNQLQELKLAGGPDKAPRKVIQVSRKYDLSVAENFDSPDDE